MVEKIDWRKHSPLIRRIASFSFIFWIDNVMQRLKDFYKRSKHGLHQRLCRIYDHTSKAIYYRDEVTLVHSRNPPWAFCYQSSPQRGYHVYRKESPLARNSQVMKAIFRNCSSAIIFFIEAHVLQRTYNVWNNYLLHFHNINHVL